jgi:hypothetical protein
LKAFLPGGRSLASYCQPRLSLWWEFPTCRRPFRAFFREMRSWGREDLDPGASTEGTQGNEEQLTEGNGTRQVPPQSPFYSRFPLCKSVSPAATFHPYHAPLETLFELFHFFSKIRPRRPCTGVNTQIMDAEGTRSRTGIFSPSDSSPHPVAAASVAVRALPRSPRIRLEPPPCAAKQMKGRL